MDTIFNFRDLGGTPTADGRVVKSGLIFRSANLDGGSDEDLSTLRSLGIRAVFDFRDLAEVTTEHPYEVMGTRHAHYPMLQQNDKLYKLSKNPSIRQAMQPITLEDVADTYRGLPFNNTGYRALFAALRSGETPLLFHCTAGKDRAGCAAMLVLLILGVDYETALLDYLKSADIKPYLQRLIGQKIPRPVRKFFVKRFDLLFGVQRELADAMYREILDRYTTLDRYAECELGLTGADISEIRQRYTE